MTTGDRGLELARAIAIAVDGDVRELPSADHVRAYGIVVDGGMPALVRDFGHLLGVSVGKRAWHPRKSEPALVAEIAGAIRPAERVTLPELALALADALSAALGERWGISIPGTPIPTEMWLHGATFDAASVGVFASRAVVWLDTAQQVTVADRAQLGDACARVVELVRAQHARYAANVERGERVRAIATALAERLAGDVGACTVAMSGRPTHGSAMTATVNADGRELVQLRADGDDVRAHAGVVGGDGWSGVIGDLDTQLPAILDAIRRARTMLTLEQLVPGERYRVRQPIGQLVAGTIVTFVGFEDIDNHHGRYQFRDGSGAIVVVDGDFSTPRHSPLGETHRYLERA